MLDVQLHADPFRRPAPHSELVDALVGVFPAARQSGEADSWPCRSEVFGLLDVACRDDRRNGAAAAGDVDWGAVS